MLQNVRGVMYERIYPKTNQDDIQKVKSVTTLFQGPVVVEKKVIAVLGYPYNGYIVRRASGVPRYLPRLSRPFNSYLKANVQLR